MTNDFSTRDGADILVGIDFRYSSTFFVLGIVLVVFTDRFGGHFSHSRILKIFSATICGTSFYNFITVLIGLILHYGVSVF